MRKKLVTLLTILSILVTFIPTVVNAKIDSMSWNGHEYRIFAIGLTWYEAQEYCEKIGGHLATITSSEEQRLLEGLMENNCAGNYNLNNDCTDYYLGGTNRSSSWQWVSGEDWNYTHWEDGQPDNSKNSQYVLRIVKSPPYGWEWEWDDTYSTDKCYGFICEWDYMPSISISITGKDIVSRNSTIKLAASIYPSYTTDKVVTWSSSDTSIATIDSAGNVTGIAPGFATITATTSNGHSASRIIEVTEDVLEIIVVGYDEKAAKEDPSYKPEPLNGASVTINNLTRQTDSNGAARFAASEVGKGSDMSYTGPVNLSYTDDYEESEEVVSLFLAGKGVTSITYKLNALSGEISFKEIGAEYKNKSFDLLSSKNYSYVSYMDPDGNIKRDTVYFDIAVDWNKYKNNKQTQRLWIESKETGKQVELKRNSVDTGGVVLTVPYNVILSDHFTPDDTLVLHAQVKDDNGKVIEKSKTLPLKLKIMEVSLPVPPTESIDTSDIYFLDKLNVELSFEDLGKIASDIAYEDGVLTLTFDDENKSEAPLGLGLADTSIKLSGEIKIPLKDSGASEEWSGSITAKTEASKEWKGDNKKTDKNNNDSGKKINIFHHTYNMPEISPPLYFELNLSAGGSATLELFGPMNKVYYRGTLKAEGEFKVSGGLGGGSDADKDGEDDTELKLGVYGKLNVELPAVYEMRGFNDDNISFDPSIKGSVGAEAKIKVWLLDLDADVELGSVTWDKNGVTWESAFDKKNSAALAGLSAENGSEPTWQLVTRDYLQNGGGFNSGVRLMGIDDTNRVPVTLYDNIVAVSDADTTIIDGTPYLLFTADDPSRDENNAVTAMYSSYSDGAWSEPQIIDDDGTVDTGISADGKFAAWENTKTKLSADLNMTEALKATEIEAAVWNGTDYVTTALTDNEIYDFGAKVASSGDNAVVAWLSNTEADYMAEKGVTSINYATYNGAWSEVKTIENVGGVTNINVLYDETGVSIVYKKDGTVYKISVNDGAADTIGEIGRYAVAGNILAHFDADKKLHIIEDGTETAVIETNYVVNENPVIACTGDNARIFWIENDGIYYAAKNDGTWSDRLCLQSDDVMLSGLSCNMIDDGNYVVSYYRNDGTKTDLMLISAVSGVDLITGTVEYDDSVYAADGNLSYTLPIVNNGETAVNGGTVNIYENNQCVYTTEFTETIAPGAEYDFNDVFSPENGRVKHDYVFEVVADGDYHSANNTSELSMGVLDAEIEDAYFGADVLGNEKLYVSVKNSGSINIENAALKVYKNSVESDPIYETSTGTMRGGQSIPFEFEEKQDSEAIYYIVVGADGDEADYNNTEILAYDRVEDLNEDTPVPSPSAAPKPDEPTTIPKVDSKYTINGITVSDGTVSVDVEKEAGTGAKVIAASYTSGGQLISVTSADVDQTGAVDVNLNTAGAAYVSAFIWDDLSDMIPVSNKFSKDL